MHLIAAGRRPATDSTSTGGGISSRAHLRQLIAPLCEAAQSSDAPYGQPVLLAQSHLASAVSVLSRKEHSQFESGDTHGPGSNFPNGHDRLPMN